MKTYPVNLLLKNKRCLIVGGGKVAARKLPALLKSGALVTVVDPVPAAKIKLAAEKGSIALYERKFVETDLDGVSLVYAATNDRDLNLSIIKMAENRNILICSVDANWSRGAFITPASVNHNNITIAVSSQGAACRKTRLIKDNLARHIDSIENTGLMVIGTDHNFAGLERRQDIHLCGERMDKAGKRIMALWGVQDFMLLNTCNRIEAVIAGHNDETLGEMIKMILKLEKLEPEEYYVKSDFEAFRHMCLLASGLLSQTPGENHITSQFKESFNYARKKKWAGSLLKALNDSVLHAAKHIRTDIIPMLKVFEIEELVMAFLKSRMKSLKGSRVLLAGTGVVGRALKDILIKEGCIVDWLYHSHKPACSDGQVGIASLDMMIEKLPEADIIISAMSSEKPVISMDMARVLKPGVGLIDLGSPRNIAHGLTGLVDMEDLKHWHRKNNCDMAVVFEKADRIIDEHKEIYEKFKKSFINGRQGQ